MTGEDRDRDRGAASVLVLAAGLVVLLFGLGVAGIGSAVVARHRAQAAADLGALAGAARAIEGEAAACTRAATIVAANRARLAACRLDGLDVIVTAEAAGPAGWVASASARAGPVEAVGPTHARQAARGLAHRAPTAHGGKMPPRAAPPAENAQMCLSSWGRA